MLEATDDMLTIEPWPRASMPGRNAWIIRKQEVTLIEKAVDQSCNEQSSTVPEGTIPAQLKSTSIVGRALASARIALSSVTSNGSFSIARVSRQGLESLHIDIRRDDARALRGHTDRARSSRCPPPLPLPVPSYRPVSCSACAPSPIAAFG